MLSDLTTSIAFKNTEDKPKLEVLDFRLRFILDLMNLYSLACKNAPITITDVDTPGLHTTQCHYDHRAVDVRLAPLSLQDWEQAALMVNSSVGLGDWKTLVVGSLDPHGNHQDHVHVQVVLPYRPTGRIAM
jgi:hypothetical protein